MAVNLLRNARVFFTTAVDATTGVVDVAHTTGDTWELQVLDNLSFSQNTAQETVTLNEAGASPVRGQIAFNTALDPVEWSFTTYMRPNVVDTATDLVTCEEKYLWNAMFAVDAIGGSNPAWTDVTAANAAKSLVVTNSQKHQFQKFGLIIVMGDQAFVIDNCAVDQATIDFGLDAIASIQWTGRGTKLRQVEGLQVASSETDGASVAFSGNNSVISGAATNKYKAAKYITNKLSTVSLTKVSGGSVSYDVPITGGSLTIANNINYLTPANLGIVNEPVTYFSGTRAISGSLNAYLRRDAVTNKTSELMAWMLDNTSTIQPQFTMAINIGGTGTVKVVADFPAVMLTVPSVNVEQVISTTINFTAISSTSNVFDVEAANEMSLKYHHPVVA